MTALRAISNFTQIDSVYGSFVINRHCAYQAEALIKTGYPHIQSELNKMLAIANTLPDGAIAIDAGANAGLVAVPLAQMLGQRGGTVHAFEVQRMMYYALCGTAALNDLANLHVHHTGLGATPGTVNLSPPDYAKPQDFGCFTLVGQDTTTGSENVNITTIDSLSLPRLDFLKIDVEGMEIEVLQGAARMIAAHLPWCWIEYWKVDMNAIKRQFDGLDYRFYIMDKLNVLAAPTARLSQTTLSITAEEI